MRTGLLPENDDTCGWIRLLPERAPARRLAGDVRADWAVLGAGFTGLAAARRLTELQPDARVVVLDACRAGEGASGRNSGFVVDVSTSRAGTDPAWDDVYLRLHRVNTHGIALLQAQVRARRIECQWSPVGEFHCAADPAGEAEIEAIAAFCRRLGLPHQTHDRAALAGRLGTDYYRCGVSTPDAVMIQPAALARGLAQCLPESVGLFEESPVLAVEPGDPVRLVCRQGTLRASRVVLAANGFLPGLGVLADRLMPLTLTASLTRALDAAERAALGDPRDWGVLAAHGMGATVRYTADYRILMRNTAEYRARPFMSPAELALRREVHARSIRARFPMLPDVTIEHTWSGAICVSRNLMPFFGRVAPNVWAAGGYNGSGVARGTAFGALLADYALGHDSDTLRDVLALPAPAWIPPRPLRDLGMRWRLRRARAGVDREL